MSVSRVGVVLDKPREVHMPERLATGRAGPGPGRASAY